MAKVWLQLHSSRPILFFHHTAVVLDSLELSISVLADFWNPRSRMDWPRRQFDGSNESKRESLMILIGVLIGNPTCRKKNPFVNMTSIFEYAPFISFLFCFHQPSPEMKSGDLNRLDTIRSAAVYLI